MLALGVLRWPLLLTSLKGGKMKIKIFFVLLLCSSNILAAPAAPGYRLFYQADGKSFEAELKGDEYFSWMEDKQGRVIQYNLDSSNYEYSVLIETNGELTLTHSGVAATNYTPMGVSSSIGNRPTIIAIDKPALSEFVKKSRLKSWLYQEQLLFNPIIQ